MKKITAILYFLVVLLTANEVNAGCCSLWSENYESYAYCVESNPHSYNEESYSKSICEEEWRINFETFGECFQYYKKKWRNITAKVSAPIKVKKGTKQLYNPRLGEIIRIRWNDVEMKSEVILIRHKKRIFVLNHYLLLQLTTEGWFLHEREALPPYGKTSQGIPVKVEAF